MGELAIRAEGVGKCFNLNRMPDLALVEAVERRMVMAKRWAGAVKNDLRQGRWPHPGRQLGRMGSEDFWALRDVSFDLNHGEVMGIIGPNGAGKSTLLKILSQVLTPSEGRVELHGRVGALLEVGSGFNPELSGRENIYLYGAILGMSRADIARRFDEIVEFAEIEKFLDQPIKNYSSGMHSRLAFSVAAHLECDILLVDEVLSVGDASFRAKCLGKMRDVTGQGRAVIFVSHNMSAIRNMCSTAMVLNHGTIQYHGLATDAIEHYMNSVSFEDISKEQNPVVLPDDEDKVLKIREVYIKDKNRNYSREIEYVDAFTIGMKVDIKEPSMYYFAAISLQDYTGNVIVFSTDEDKGQSLISQQGRGLHEFEIDLPGKLFCPGEYSVMWAASRQKTGKVDKYENLITLNIKDTQTWRGQRGLYRRGVSVAPELDWSVSKINEAL